MCLQHKYTRIVRAGVGARDVHYVGVGGTLEDVRAGVDTSSVGGFIIT